MTPKTWPERMQLAMTQRGFSATKLAEEAGVSEAAVSRWLSGERSPNGKNVARLARALDVSTDWLMEGKGEPARDVDYESAVAEGFSMTSVIERVLFEFEWPNDVGPEEAGRIASQVRKEHGLYGSHVGMLPKYWQARLRTLVQEARAKR